MTNRAWKELISAEFGVSKNVASKMIHAMLCVYNFYKKEQW